MDAALSLLSSPAAWAALVTLIVLEVVLGIDNLIFISLLTNKLPEASRAQIRRLGIALALVLRLVLLSTISWLTGLTAPVIDLGLSAANSRGELLYETAFSWRDLILLGGGLFLVWKATREIGHTMDEGGHGDATESGITTKATLTAGSAIVQILALDMVFSVDSILTAIGMTDHLPIMFVAVIVAVVAMMVAAEPLANFINRNPSVVMLALAFLLMIGLVLIADACGVHVPKGYIYAAMAFSALVESLNLTSRRRKARAAPHDARH